MGSRKSETASVQLVSAPVYSFFSPPLKTDGKGRPGQESKGCRAKLGPSFAAELEFSLEVSAILPAFEEKLEDVD